MSEQASPSSSMQSQVPVTGLTVETLYALVSAQVDSVKALMEANDLRYAQRFEAQAEALTAAFNAAEKAVKAALEAAERAVEKAEIATEKRLEGMNEFRQTLTDQASTFMPRNEAHAEIRAMNEKIAAIERIQSIQAGRGAGGAAVWAAIAVGAGIVVALITLALRFTGR